MLAVFAYLGVLQQNIESDPTSFAVHPRHERSVPAKAQVVHVVLAAVLLPVWLRATTIVILRNSDVIVIAADSRVSNGNLRAVPGTVCKISRAGGLVWVSAYFHSDPRSGINVDDLVREALATGGTGSPRAAALAFEDRACKPLAEEMARLRFAHSPFFRAIWSGRGPFLELAFVGIQRGLPYSLRDFWVTGLRAGTPCRSDSRTYIQRVDCPGSGCGMPGRTAVMVLGNHGAIQAFLPTHPQVWREPLPAVARGLVQLEIASRPGLVGPPIDVAQVDASGFHWIARQGCAAEKR